MPGWVDRQTEREGWEVGRVPLKGNILNVALVVLLVAKDEDVYPKVRPYRCLNTNTVCS